MFLLLFLMSREGNYVALMIRLSPAYIWADNEKKPVSPQVNFHQVMSNGRLLAARTTLPDPLSRVSSAAFEVYLTVSLGLRSIIENALGGLALSLINCKLMYRTQRWKGLSSSK